MPIYVHGCEECGKEREDFLSISAPPPDCCGKPMAKRLQPCGMAFLTKNGNWFNRTAAAGKVYKGGGRPKPRSIGKGHGVGGRRPPPSIRKHMAENGIAPPAKEK
jgi:predicted nucleic acid-binding Zn ribbon protein